MITFEFPIFILTERIIEKIPRMFLLWCSIYMNIVHITMYSGTLYIIRWREKNTPSIGGLMGWVTPSPYGNSPVFMPVGAL